MKKKILYLVSSLLWMKMSIKNEFVLMISIFKDKLVYSVGHNINDFNAMIEATKVLVFLIVVLNVY